MALQMLTQTQLIDALAFDTGYTRSDIRHFLQSLTECVADQVSSGHRVRVAGIQVEPKLRKATKKRMGRNPQTGEPVQISAKPASVVLKAKVVKPLKDVQLPSTRRLANLR